MKQVKHTPGPWILPARIAGDNLMVRDVKGMPIADAGQRWDVDEGIANLHLIAAAPSLLEELRAAHQIIRNALQIMTTPQKNEWARANARDGVDGDGATRAHERDAAINRASGD